MKKFLIAGNWKMNPARLAVADLINGIKAGINDKPLPEILVCPPHVYLNEVASLIAGSTIMLGAQNCYTEINGAFTGETSASFLREYGCKYVILGHSERRMYFNETNEFIASKIKTALSENLKPILCIGELLEERKSGNTETVLRTQITECLNHYTSDETDRLIIAYEPVWAIGTGISATADQAREAHEFIRSLLLERFGEKGRTVTLLYGGSMNDTNAEELLSQNEVEGGLIGGASLKADQFVKIIKTADKLAKEI